MQSGQNHPFQNSNHGNEIIQINKPITIFTQEIKCRVQIRTINESKINMENNNNLNIIHKDKIIFNFLINLKILIMVKYMNKIANKKYDFNYNLI